MHLQDTRQEINKSILKLYRKLLKKRAFFLVVGTLSTNLESEAKPVEAIALDFIIGLEMRLEIESTFGLARGRIRLHFQSKL